MATTGVLRMHDTVGMGEGLSFPETTYVESNNDRRRDLLLADDELSPTLADS